MKFVKENMTVLISAVVALLLLVAVFVYPLPGWKDDLQTAMKTRLGVKDEIVQMANTSLVLPGQPEVKGIPTTDYVEARKQSIKDIGQMKDKVIAAVQELNDKGRIKGKSTADAVAVPILPLLPDGKEEPDLLPRLRTDSMSFKTDYNKQFRQWTALLAWGMEGDALQDKEPNLAAPPDLADVQADVEQMLKSQPTRTPSVSGSSQDQLLRKQAVMNRAAKLRMFVDKGAFQVRGWSNNDTPPTDSDVFEGLVDSWIQSDIVKAIDAVNKQSDPTAGSHEIGRSAVKRLGHIMVGSNARNALQGSQGPGGMAMMPVGAPGGATTSADGGPLFLTGSAGTAGAAAGENSINYDLSLTGHSSGKTYDVVLVAMDVDIDPSYISAFEDQLYRQNLGYIVLSEQIRTVDPLERASNGYLYGGSQVVQLTLVVEHMMMRDWLVPLMPDQVRATLGIPPAAPAPAK